jgi:hypothetical protein
MPGSIIWVYLIIYLKEDERSREQVCKWKFKKEGKRERGKEGKREREKEWKSEREKERKRERERKGENRK